MNFVTAGATYCAMSPCGFPSHDGDGWQVIMMFGAMFLFCIILGGLKELWDWWHQ